MKERTADALTLRECEVICGYEHGMTNREIAAAMHISPNTVNTLGDKIRAKLGAKTRAHAVAIFERTRP